MYDEIQKLIAPNYLTSFEYTKLEELKQTYTEQQILDAYKNSKVKNINYIIKVLETKKQKVKPEWFDKEIKETEIDKEAEETFEDFNNFLEEFRNE